MNKKFMPFAKEIDWYLFADTAVCIDENLDEISNVCEFMIDVTNIFVRTGLDCDETHELLEKIQVTEDWIDKFSLVIGGICRDGDETKVEISFEKYKELDNSMYYVQNCVMNVVEFIKDVVENYKELAIADERMDDVERLEFSAWNSMLEKTDKMVDAVHSIENELNKYLSFSWKREI